MSMFKKVVSLWLAVIIFIIGVWVIVGTLIVKGCKAIQKDGLKGVSEQVWNGTNTPPAPEVVK